MKMTLILSAAVCVLSLQCQARAQQALQEKLTVVRADVAKNQQRCGNTLRQADEGPAQGEVKAQGPFSILDWCKPRPRNLSRTIDRPDSMHCFYG